MDFSYILLEMLNALYPCIAQTFPNYCAFPVMLHISAMVHYGHIDCNIMFDLIPNRKIRLPVCV